MPVSLCCPVQRTHARGPGQAPTQSCPSPTLASSPLCPSTREVPVPVSTFPGPAHLPEGDWPVSLPRTQLLWPALHSSCPPPPSRRPSHSAGKETEAGRGEGTPNLVIQRGGSWGEREAPGAGLRGWGTRGIPGQPLPPSSGLRTQPQSLFLPKPRPVPRMGGPCGPKWCGPPLLQGCPRALSTWLPAQQQGQQDSGQRLHPAGRVGQGAWRGFREAPAPWPRLPAPAPNNGTVSLPDLRDPGEGKSLWSPWGVLSVCALRPSELAGLGACRAGPASPALGRGSA